MSDLDEPRIRCLNCGKNAPAMKYCIYCGAQLPSVDMASEKIVAPSIRLPSTLPPEVPPPRPSIQQVRIPVVSSAPVALENEVNNLMSNIASLYERKVALLGLFQSGEVVEGTYLNSIANTATN